MATITSVVGTRTSLTTSALNSLASATYVNAGTITFNGTDPLGALLEVAATPGTVSGNKQLVVFAQESLDGTNFMTGPTSGTTTTDEPNLRFLGVLPVNTNSTAQTTVIRYPEPIPYAAKIIVKNDSGAALAASGHSVYYSLITGAVA